MKFFFKQSLILIFLSLIFLSQPLWSASTTMERSEPKTDDDLTRYVRMADNFFIFYDPSNTMDVPYKDTGLTRIEAQKEIIARSNRTLPDLGWQTGLYPHWKGGLWLHGSPMGFKPYYRLHRYDQSVFSKAIEALPVTPQGPPMLQAGLMKLEHLLGLPGRTEVFLFSDGGESTFELTEKPPIEQARILAEAYDVCFTVINSATTPEGKQVVEAIGSVNSCSQVIDFDTVYNNPEHLLGKLYMDTDSTRFTDILFAFDKSEVRTKYATTLDNLGNFLSQHSKTYVVLSGFTDNIGAEAYNIELSRKRAQAVRKYLQSRYAIAEKRILTYWYGDANPVAANTSGEGRQLNRRVTITLRGKKQ